MEFVQFADLKPTWDIVKFDEGIEDIPCISKNGYRKQNPLDKNIALLFEPERRVNVYYLPKTGGVIVRERNMYGEKELSEAFGTKVCDYYQMNAKQTAVRPFLYEMVIGEYLVYRCFTESDEISLLFDKDEDTFGRKVRKYNSTLAGEASAAISLELGRVATFDCRMVPLPTIERVQDYFRWRQEDANRNALNSHCYWMLRKEGRSVHEATEELEGKGVSYKNELLFARGINYDKLPSWQKRGVGLWNEQYEKEGYNPMTKENVSAVRSRIHVEYELPLGDAYAEMVAGFVKE